MDGGDDGVGAFPLFVYCCIPLQWMLTSPAYESYHVVITSNIPANRRTGGEYRAIEWKGERYGSTEMYREMILWKSFP
jgi:hypothetical protein